LREGKKVADWNVSAGVAAKAAGLNESALLAKARSAEIEQRVRTTTKEFHAMEATQRPTFVLDSSIEDRVMFSGCWRTEPLIATIDSMLSDAAAYASWKAHCGDPPAS